MDGYESDLEWVESIVDLSNQDIDFEEIEEWALEEIRIPTAGMIKINLGQGRAMFINISEWGEVYRWQ